VGLGLAVLYGIVKDHDGEVEVASERNEGTSFSITLPLKARAVLPVRRKSTVQAE